MSAATCEASDRDDQSRETFCYVFSIQNYGNCQWKLWKSAKANLYSMCLSSQSFPIVQFCSLAPFYAVGMKSKSQKSKELRVKQRSSSADLKEYFLDSAHPMNDNYHKMSVRITSAISSLACWFWHIPALFETGKYEGSPQYLTEGCTPFDC